MASDIFAIRKPIGSDYHGAVILPLRAKPMLNGLWLIGCSEQQRHFPAPID
ncbi:hypothetical protein [Rhodopseudomonas palustris]|uniref:hypothetical protein n=1 Tax=Rhodopseudomonas palustris TaxID=1076 RepID=UPI00140415EC|nr:hypothetical protein [Rhodopseudomonas palustris]